MANPEHLEILKQGVAVWNKWRKENPKISPELDHADLERIELKGANLKDSILDMANLIGADLRGANLTQVFLNGAKLRKANMSDANLSWAKLIGAVLNGASLSGADLSLAMLNEADLSEVDLRWATLVYTDLRGANLESIKIYSTVFGNVDLSTAVGLETAHHEGPSTVGIDTVYASGGKIPEVFLRGCGVPENFIQYMSSLTGKAFEYYSCFISYSSQDRDFAERLYADLQNKGVRCWFAPEDIKGG